VVEAQAGARTVELRELKGDEISSLWTIDRREVIEAVYALEDGQLVLNPQHWDMLGWPPGEQETYTPLLRDCFDHGGAFIGAFDDAVLVGVVVLEGRFIGRRRDRLQLKFLHVSQSHRKQGLGRVLFREAEERARRLGARKLYISATPSENTVDFYRHLGCRIAEEVDAELFALEPEDIHLEYVIPHREQRRSTGTSQRAAATGPAPCTMEGGQCTPF